MSVALRIDANARNSPFPGKGGWGRKDYAIKFDVSRPRFRVIQVVVVAFFAMLMVTVLYWKISNQLPEGNGAPGFLGMTVLALVGSGIGYAVGIGCVGIVRRANRRLLSRAQHERPDTLYAGYARKVNAQGRAPRFTSGPLTIAPSGITHSPGVRIQFPGAIEVSWDDVDAVVFHPALDLVGRLQLTMHDGSKLAWQIRDDCTRACDALTTIRDSAQR